MADTAESSKDLMTAATEGARLALRILLEVVQEDEEAGNVGNRTPESIWFSLEDIRNLVTKTEERIGIQAEKPATTVKDVVLRLRRS